MVTFVCINCALNLICFFSYHTQTHGFGLEISQATRGRYYRLGTKPSHPHDSVQYMLWLKPFWGMVDTMLNTVKVVVNLCVLLTIEIERMLFSEVRIWGDAAFTRKPNDHQHGERGISRGVWRVRFTSAIPQKGLLDGRILWRIYCFYES